MPISRSRGNRHSDQRENREAATDSFPSIAPPRRLYDFDRVNTILLMMKQKELR